MADPENFTLSSLDEYRRVSNDSNDEEKGLETTPSPAQAEKIENPSNNGFHLLVWMTLNTFATIGIVSRHAENANADYSHRTGFRK